MIFQSLVCILLFHLLLFAYAEDSHSVFIREPWFRKSNVKREVNLEIFDDIKKVKEEDKNENDVVNVCENENYGKPCTCYDKRLECTDCGLKTANLRPVIANFVVETVFFENFQNLTLEQDKILPGNEVTITKIEIIQCIITKIENNAFDNLTSLKTLDFYGSSLPIIDEDILTEKLRKVLLKLLMTKCKMTNINLSIFKNLVNLKELNLGENHQKSGTFDGIFPESLSKLEFLKLHSCNLSSLNADTVKYLRNLVELNLHVNKFTLVPSTIKFLTNLETLYFGYNELVTIKTNDFVSNAKLIEISLELNWKLKSVENCAFCNIERTLKKIVFHACPNLSYIDENAFGLISNGATPKLKEFNIVDCNISVLHENLLNWKNVEKMRISGNPFACNCSMAWLFNDLMSNNSIYEKKTASWVYGPRHKFELGCLGPPPRTPNHTFPYTIVEIFSSCEKSSPSSNIYWYFSFLFLCFLAFVASVVYAIRHHLQTLF